MPTAHTNGNSNNGDPRPSAPRSSAPRQAEGNTRPAPSIDGPVSKLAAQVKEEVLDTAGELKQAANGIAGQASKAAKRELLSTKDRAADGLEGVAAALRTTAEQLNASDEEGFVNGYVDAAAEKVEGAADYLHQKGFGEMVRDLEDYARREPAMFIGGALLAGLLGGRFLKSSRSASTGNSSAPSSMRAPSRRGPQGRELSSGQRQEETPSTSGAV